MKVVLFFVSSILGTVVPADDMAKFGHKLENFSFTQTSLCVAQTTPENIFLPEREIIWCIRPLLCAVSDASISSFRKKGRRFAVWAYSCP